MTGPEHYERAGRLLEQATGILDASVAPEDRDGLVARQAGVASMATAHAVLSLAAAVGLSAHLDAADGGAISPGRRSPTSALRPPSRASAANLPSSGSRSLSGKNRSSSATEPTSAVQAPNCVTRSHVPSRRSGVPTSVTTRTRQPPEAR
jgi:hypothetical protein